jgi:hypothetical protein
MVEVYRECGYETLELPWLSPPVRADWIRAALTAAK